MFDYCREIGFESINVDLIYGLPHQTVESFSDTVSKIIAMKPDRIAVFSYAHVPWMKKQQGSFTRFLPDPLEKFRIFARAIEMLTDAGYPLHRIGSFRATRRRDMPCAGRANAAPQLSGLHDEGRM